MSKLTTIDRDACRILRNAINDCLAKISDEHGIRFTAGSGSFDSGQVTFKVECALVNNGEVLSKETTDFKRYAAMFGLSPDDLGREFFHSGKRYKIVGCKPQSRKYPILCEQISTGKRIKFPEENCRVWFKKCQQLVSNNSLDNRQFVCYTCARRQTNAKSNHKPCVTQ